MTVSSIWVPIYSAIAALIGGGIGALLQGRYGVSSWRRQIRLQEYVRFVEITHDFNDCFTEALDAIDTPRFDDNWSKLRDAYWRMGRAASALSIAGPLSVDVAAVRVMANTRQLIKGGKDPKVLSVIATSMKENGSHEERTLWIKSAGDFAVVARMALNTQGRLPYRRIRFRVTVDEHGRAELGRYS